MTDTSSTTDRPSQAHQLRILADLLDAHPGLPTPFICAYTNGTVEAAFQLMNSTETKDDQRAVAIQIRRSLGGEWTKEVWGDRFDLVSERDGIKLAIFTQRDQVCERIVTGTETVTIPAVEARPARTEEREVVEWRCEPLLDTHPVSA